MLHSKNTTFPGIKGAISRESIEASEDVPFGLPVSTNTVALRRKNDWL